MRSAAKFMTLLLSTQMGCAGIQTAFVSKIDEEMRMQQACSGFSAGPNEIPSAFFGTDSRAIDRMKVSLGVGPSSRPWTSLEKRLKEVAGAINNDYGNDEQKKAVKDLKEDLTKAVATVNVAISHWNNLAEGLEDQADKIGKSGLPAAMASCARHKLGGESVSGSCSWSADVSKVLRVGGALLAKSSVLAKDMEDITAAVRDVRKDLAQIRRLSADAKVVLSAERIGDIEHALAEMLALGGVLADGYSDAKILGANDGDSGRRVIAVAQFIVSLQSDRVVDVIIFWIGKGVAKLEKQIATIDEAAYGLVSTATSIASQTKAAQKGLCRISDFVEDQLALAGVDKGAFGARACHALMGEKSAYPDSELMASILRAMLFASADLCEGGKGDDEDEKFEVNEFQDDPVPPDVPMFRNVGGDIESIADALWDSRVTVAAHQLRTVPIDELGVENLPRRGDIPAMLLAPLWVSRRVNSAEIEALEGEGRWADAFLRVQEGAFKLKGPYEVVANVYVCGGPDSPPFCQFNPVDLSQTNDAVTSVAVQICKQNAAEARKSAAEILCAHAERTFEGSETENPCLATSQGAFFDVYERFDDMESFNYPPRKKSRASGALDLVLHVIATHPMPAGQVEVHIQGRASSKVPTPESASKLLSDLRGSGGDAWCGDSQGFACGPENTGFSCWPAQNDVPSSTSWRQAESKACEDFDQLGEGVALTWIANQMLAQLRAVDARHVLDESYPSFCKSAKCIIDPPVIESSHPDTAKFRAVTIEVTINDTSYDCDF